MRLSAAVLALACFAQPAFACSAAHLVRIYDPKKVAIPNDLGTSQAPPALSVEIVEVRRGKPDPLFCGSDATFRIKVSWKSATTLKLGDFGFYIRNLTENSGDSFSSVNFPVTPEIVGGEAFFDLNVPHDSPPHKSINIEAEILAVNAKMQIGPGTRFSLTSDAD